MIDTKGSGTVAGGGPRGGFPGGGAIRGGRMRTPSTRTSPRIGKSTKKTALNTRGNKGLISKKKRAELVENEKNNQANKRDFGPRARTKVVKQQPPTLVRVINTTRKGPFGSPRSIVTRNKPGTRTSITGRKSTSASNPGSSVSKKNTSSKILRSSNSSVAGSRSPSKRTSPRPPQNKRRLNRIAKKGGF